MSALVPLNCCVADPTAALIGLRPLFQVSRTQITFARESAISTRPLASTATPNGYPMSGNTVFAPGFALITQTGAEAGVSGALASNTSTRESGGFGSVT